MLKCLKKTELSRLINLLLDWVRVPTSFLHVAVIHAAGLRFSHDYILEILTSSEWLGFREVSLLPEEMDMIGCVTQTYTQLNVRWRRHYISGLRIAVHVDNAVSIPHLPNVHSVTWALTFNVVNNFGILSVWVYPTLHHCNHNGLKSFLFYEI